MTGELPTNNPEQRKTLEDNARKFVVENFSLQTLHDANPTSFTLVTDWIETNKDNETKVAHKTFTDGDVQILFITKVSNNGNRTSDKKKLADEEYAQLLTSSIVRITKQRHEFAYAQNDTVFKMNYDEFADSTLKILEVDAANEAERDAFDPTNFPAKLTEVTGNLDYYGYRISHVV